MKQNLFYLLIPLLVFTDQISKILASESGVSIIYNTGLIFGWGKNSNLIIFITVITMIIFVTGFLKFKLNQYSVILILAGALSNFLDRLFLGYVRDFIDLGFWPAFNLSDVMIVLGVGILIYDFLRERSFLTTS